VGAGRRRDLRGELARVARTYALGTLVSRREVHTFGRSYTLTRDPVGLASKTRFQMSELPFVSHTDCCSWTAV